VQQKRLEIGCLEMTTKEQAVVLAREALRGFFDDATGFEKMDTKRQKLAIERVEMKLHTFNNQCSSSNDDTMCSDPNDS
jgi:hypothetical protein